VKRQLFSLFVVALVGRTIVMAEDDPVAELQQAFLDLSHNGVIMNISAHPDDEDGATLAYYRMKYGVKTYSVFFTRGEGGQNEIGPELYADLGVIRSEETRRAAEIQRTEAFFLNLMDFGYSKSADETFEKWGGKRAVLRRLVYFIRKIKPDIIFTNHNPSTGHGHHRAVAITALTAFDSSSSPILFPEQLELPGVHLWQPRKLFFRAFNRGGEQIDVSNAVGEVNPLLGKSYLDIASKALQEHRSQGMDKADLRRFTRGLSLYKLLRSDSSYITDTTSFFSGISIVVPPASKSMGKAAISIQELISSTKKNLVPRVSRLLMDINALKKRDIKPLEIRLLQQWREELQTILRLQCGLTFEAKTEDSVLIPDQSSTLRVLFASDKCDARLDHVAFGMLPGWNAQEQGSGSSEHSDGRTLEQVVTLSNDVIPTLPRSLSQYGPLETQNANEVYLHLVIEGEPVTLTTTIRGEVAQPLELLAWPEIAWLSPERAREGKMFSYRITNRFPHKIAGVVRVDTPPGWWADGDAFAISSEDSNETGTILVKPPREITSGEHRIRFSTDYASSEAIIKVFHVNLMPSIRLGIIKSYDNTLEAVAEEFSIPYDLLDHGDLANGDLSIFTSIVIDMRAYGMREDLRTNNSRLLEYVKGGGNLIVMYQKDQDWKKEYSPYPFSVTRKRVVDESAPVTVLLPNHPLLNRPNVITAEDWDGWVQERGVYFPDEVAKEYEQLVTSHDIDEDPLSTGYLGSGYGKGSYIYSSYVWYRQLKEKHEGAMKCFANMISFPLVK